MIHPDTPVTCPACGEPAFRRDNGDIHCLDVGYTMTPQQATQAVRARENAKAIINAGSYAAYKAAVHGQVTP